MVDTFIKMLALLPSADALRLASDMIAAGGLVAEKALTKKPPGLGTQACAQAKSIDFSSLDKACPGKQFQPTFCSKKIPPNSQINTFLSKLSPSFATSCRDVYSPGNNVYFVYPYLDQPRPYSAALTKKDLEFLANVIQRRNEISEETLKKILSAFIYNARLRRKTSKILPVEYQNKRIYFSLPFSNQNDFDTYTKPFQTTQDFQNYIKK